MLTVTGLGLDFPHVVEAAMITHYRADLRTGDRTLQTVHTLTDLSHQRASPQRIGELARPR